MEEHPSSIPELVINMVSVCHVQSIRAINGTACEMSAEDFANMVFDKIDINGDGEFLLQSDVCEVV